MKLSLLSIFFFFTEYLPLKNFFASIRNVACFLYISKRNNTNPQRFTSTGANVRGQYAIASLQPSANNKKLVRPTEHPPAARPYWIN